MSQVRWVDGEPGPRVGPVPADVIDEARARRRRLEETVAELHAGALEEYCTGGLSTPSLVSALRDLTGTGAGVVVLAGAAYRNRGVEPLLDAVLAYLPSPADVPAVRGTWGTAEPVRPAHPDAPAAALVFKVTAAPTGRLTFVRLYSGTLRKGGTVLDAVSGRSERIGRILHVHADRQTEVTRAVAGDIVALVGPRAARTGTTLCDPAAPVLLEPPGVPDPVVRVAVEAAHAVEHDQLVAALTRLAEQDPSLNVGTDPDSGQTVLAGMGELHLEVVAERLRRDHGLTVRTGAPQVAYRETPASAVTGLRYRHAKQDGGAGQFAEVVLDVEPLDDDTWAHGPATGDQTAGGQAAADQVGFAFASTVTGGRVPREFVRAVEAGCRDAVQAGPQGHPVIGVRVRLIDGATHVRDSSELAFRAAGRLALQQALRAGGTRLLEPIAEVTVTVPDDAVGSVLGDLGRPRGTQRRGHARRIPARGSVGVESEKAPRITHASGCAERRLHRRGR